MSIQTIRLRYTQIFIICLLGISLYTTTQSLAGGTSQFESNLWGREFLVASFTRVRLTLGDRVFSQALVGKDGWLEFTKVRNLDGYQNVIKTTPQSMRNTQKKLQKLYEELRKRNIILIVVIPPNKATIYPDKLPDEIRKLGKKSRLDAFTIYMRQHGPPVLIDLRPALLDERKKQQEIYYKTDTHWNGYSVFIAYKEILKELSKTYSQLAPKSVEDFKIINRQSYVHDIAKIMGATHIFEPGIDFAWKKDNATWLNLNDEKTPFQISTVPNNNLPTLLMYKDSFGIGIQYLIAPHFRKATFIENGSKHPDALSLNTMLAIKPDVVIIEIVERLFNVQYLDTFLDKCLSE